MAARQAVIKVDGKFYMDTKAAAGLWGVTSRTVAAYCKAGEIPGSFKDSGGKWCVPIEAVKPLSKAELKRILILSLQLQNNPDYDIDYEVLGVDPEELPQIYVYLAERGYVGHVASSVPAARVPYEVRLTQKGMDLAVFEQPDDRSGSTAKIQDLVDRWGPTILKIIAAWHKAA